MIAAGLAAGLLASAPGPAAVGDPPAATGLPDVADARYRVEIGGAHVGWASLAVTCAPARPGAATCRVTWQSRLRAPEEAGGAVLSRVVDAEATPDGRARRVRATIENELGARDASAGEGPVPASLAELLLSRAAEGERRCVEVRDEATGDTGAACARRRGEWLEGEILGVGVRFRARPGEPPDEVVVASQRARFIADPEARLPERAPKLEGSRVPIAPGTPVDGALRFCGVDAERGEGGAGTARGKRPPAEVPARVPREFPEGRSCREKTARYVATAASAGLRARHVVGVAWDGREFAWHEWAEVAADGRWIAVDPSFRQLPAAGPRFGLARFESADESARAAAGREILRCWARARVEAATAAR